MDSGGMGVGVCERQEANAVQFSSDPARSALVAHMVWIGEAVGLSRHFHDTAWWPGCGYNISR